LRNGYAAVNYHLLKYIVVTFVAFVVFARFYLGRIG
jgi:hypothetical protein